MWWPRLDSDMEMLARQCVTCLVVKNIPPPAPLNPWVWHSRPWESLHLDFAGPFLGSMFLITVDAHAKLLEVYVMPNTTVATPALPSQIGTDNGPQSISQKFAVHEEQWNQTLKEYTIPFCLKWVS